MNILFKNIRAIVPNGDSDEVKEVNICVSGEDIVAVGDVPAGFKADREVDGTGKLAIPGLINCHTHSYMSFMRNAADDLSFMDWLFGKVDPIEQKMTDEDAYWGACLAIIEMVKSGTTCFNDMHMNKMQTTKAVKESGIRAVIGRGIVGSMEGDKPDEGGLRRINDILEEREAFKDCDRMTFCLAPHAPYTVDAPFMRYISDVAKKEGMNIHVHLSESVSEIEGVKEKHGCSPIKLAADNGLFDVPCIAAHCVQVDEADIDIMKEHGVSVVSNPASNMKLGNGFAPIPAMLKKDVNVCLGTDGAASNNRLNLFHEMSLMALIHKGTERDPQVVSAKEVFKMATINGAKALGLSDKIGSLEAGKKADIAILDLNSPSLIPDNNLIAALSYSVSGGEVTDVMVNGEFIMEERKMKFLDEEKVYSKVREITKRIVV
ncbi:MAG: amidohydrolase [Lachnospiraceae bacterium]|nr:amidohydrolase [Lachnospiraceae bacterium]